MSHQMELPEALQDMVLTVARAQRIEAQLMYDRLQHIHDAVVDEDDE